MKYKYRVVTMFLFLISLSGARAGSLLVPNGNPTGVKSAAGAKGSANLNPVPAVEQIQPQVGPLSTDDLLAIALGAQGFGKANGWTLDFIPLAGDDITLGTYTAFADKRPLVKQGALTAPAKNIPGYGGAAIGLNYNGANDKSKMDPTKDTHWIQFIEDNNPNAFEKAHGVADPLRRGFTLSIDDPFAPQNAAGDPLTPFYDAGTGLADSTDFIDRPFDPLNASSQLRFYTFVVTEPKAKTLDIYDDVAWGFTTTPEPGTTMLLGTGLIVLASIGRLRRKRARAIVERGSAQDRLQQRPRA